MAEITSTRMTAAIEGDFVVFLIGMRINKVWEPHKWWPAFRAMPRMLKELAQHPESGFLGHISSGLMTVQYWRSFEHLEAYARSQDNLHWPNWVAFNKRMPDSRDDVGVLHETYQVRAGEYEAIYSGMPAGGSAARALVIPAAGQRDSVRGRMIQNKVADLVSREKQSRAGKNSFAKKEISQMLHELNPSHGVMEGNGSYNRHAKLPADGATMALPLLEKAIKSVELDPGDGPVVVADYGSSQGKNSMVPMQVAVKGLRMRIAPGRAISVFHIDQSANDFNSLFKVLEADPNRYFADDQDVYPAAIGRSFYEKVLPPGSVHLGWSSYAAMWLSQIPALLPGHFLAIRCNGTARAAFDRQAAQDWETFLSLRARELRPGGRLVVVVPAITDDESVTLEPLFDHANAVLEEMVADGTITSEERSRMTIRVHPTRKSDRLAPFERNGEFQQLILEDSKMFEVSDTAWEQFELDRDTGALASTRALFLRSVFAPSLACALSPARGANGAAAVAFADELEQRLKQRLMDQPEEMRSLAHTLVLAKKKRS
jgi:hypothetical protein